MANSQPDMTVADAMNRVLEVEQRAGIALAAAEADAESRLREARDQRRRILDRARDRASRLHVKAQARLADQLSQLDARAQAAGGLLEPLESIAQRAIDRLAHRLVCDDHDGS